MTMPNKRLEYEALKAVLQSLEPNLRIQLALQIPSIKTTEKIVTMKMEHLATEDARTVINDKTYQIGIYRQYHDPDQTPLYHHEANKRGGFEADIDQWGLQKNRMEDPVTNGDIDLRPAGAPWGENPELEQMYTEFLVFHQEALRRLANRNGKILEPNFVVPELQNIPNSELIISQNEEMIQDALRKTVENLQKSFDFYRCEFLPYYYRNHNILPPYTPLLQLTISGPNGKLIERVTHSKRLYEAMKYLNTKFFGERRHTIRVKEYALVNHSFILRFPSDMRIRVRQIQSHSISFEKLTGFIDPASYPLDILRIESGMIDSNSFEQEVVKSSKKLVISNYFFEIGSWIPIVQNLKNQNIVLKYQTKLHVPQHYMNLIGNWLGSERTSGTGLTVGFRQRVTVVELLGLVGNQFEAIRISERSLTLPMKNGAKLLVSCEHVEVEVEGSRNNAQFLKADRDTETNWILKLIVV